MAYRICERDLVEAFLKTSHVPTRTELDEAYRRIYELRNETKELRIGLKGVPGELVIRQGQPWPHSGKGN